MKYVNCEGTFEEEEQEDRDRRTEGDKSRRKIADNRRQPSEIRAVKN